MNIQNQQVSTIGNTLPRALEYHYKNFKRLEKIANPINLKDGMNMAKATIHLNALDNIKFEIQAYLCQLRRFYHFIRYSEKNFDLKAPKTNSMLEVWDALMQEDGMVYRLANKWVAHRSVDWPKKNDDKRTHREVIGNLDGGVTFWEGDHLTISLGKHKLDLCTFHTKIMIFLPWVLREIDRIRKREKTF